MKEAGIKEKIDYVDFDGKFFVTTDAAKMLCRLQNYQIACEHDCFNFIMHGYLISDAIKATEHLEIGESMKAYFEGITKALTEFVSDVNDGK